MITIGSNIIGGGVKLETTPYHGGPDGSGDPYIDENGVYVQGKGTGFYFIQFISDDFPNRIVCSYLIYVEQGRKYIELPQYKDSNTKYYHYDTNKLYFTELAGFYYDNSIVIFLGNIN